MSNFHLLGRNEPAILAISYTADHTATHNHLLDYFSNVSYDPEQDHFTIRTGDLETSYIEYVLPRDHAIVLDQNTHITHIDDLYTDYYPLSHDDTSTNDLLNDLTLRVANLEQALEKLTPKPRKKPVTDA